MKETDLIDYAMQQKSEYQRRLDQNGDLLESIKHFAKKFEKNRIYVNLSYVKYMGKYKDTWGEIEKSLSFEERCRRASLRQAFHEGNIEMFYLFCGSGVNYIGDKGYKVTQGDFWVMGKSVYHNMALQDDALLMNILVDPLYITDMFENCGGVSNSVSRFFERNVIEGEMVNEFLRWSLNGQKDLYDLLYLILKENMEERPLYSKMTRNATLLLLHQFSRLEIEKENAKKAEVLDIYVVYEYISSNFRTVTLQSTAEQFHYSPSAFSRMIQKETGKSFSEIVRAMKLKKGKELLANSEMSIEEIASYLQYSNRFSFERAFREMFNITPREYQQSVRER